MTRNPHDFDLSKKTKLSQEIIDKNCTWVNDETEY